jgi:hypothetical protein
MEDGTYNCRFTCTHPWATLAFEYSETLRSKKFVFPCRDIISIKSNGFLVVYNLGHPSEVRRTSATNSIYKHIWEEFMPMRSTGRESKGTVGSTGCLVGTPSSNKDRTKTYPGERIVRFLRLL